MGGSQTSGGLNDTLSRFVLPGGTPQVEHLSMHDRFSSGPWESELPCLSLIE